MASGVAVADDCVTKFNELKLGHTYRYLILKLNDDSTEIIVEHEGGPDATYDEFKGKLPADDGRYAIFDFEFDTKDGGKRNKILFILWAPDSAKIKSKMLYTSSKADLKKMLVGIGAEIQGTDNSEIDEAEVLEKCKQNTR